MYADDVKNSFKIDELNKELKKETQGYLKITKIMINEKKYVLTTHLEIAILFSADMYHLVKINKGKMTANLAKLFKKKRREEICNQIEKKFNEKMKNEISNRAGWRAFASPLIIDYKLRVV